MVRPRSCRVIYYFDTPALEIRHQSFGRVNYLEDKDYFESKDYLKDKDRMTKAHYSP